MPGLGYEEVRALCWGGTLSSMGLLSYGTSVESLSYGTSVESALVSGQYTWSVYTGCIHSC